MKKTSFLPAIAGRGRIFKVLLFMKWCFILVFATCLQAAANGYSQNVRLTLHLEDIKLGKALSLIGKKSDVRFLYSNDLVPVDKLVEVHASDKPLTDVLHELLSGMGLHYRILENKVVVVAPASRMIRVLKVSGTVTDTTGMPLIGVSIQVKGTGKGTVSDNNGRYTIEAPEDAVLVFSYVGYEPLEMPVAGKQQLNVRLRENPGGLNEVVVVGYGTQKKISLTTAVSSVSGDEVAARHAPNLQASLQGLAPGLSVWDQGGEPGNNSTYFRIRGVTTLGSNTPLFIIDGVEQAYYDINPDDIASVSVLKDAASTAIYGSRAANGVVLITTRRAQKGDIRIRYNGWLDLQNLVAVPEHMDTESYLRLQNLAYENRGSNPLYTEEAIQQYVSGEDRLRYPLPNSWYDAVIRENAPWQNHSLQLSGGSEKLTSLLSARYMDQQGIYPNRNMQRYQMRLNNTLKISESISLNADIKLRRQNRYTTNTVGSGIYHYMIHGSQLTVPRYPDGTYGVSNQGRNPLAYTDPDIAGYTKSTNDNAVINLQGTWKILKGLTFNTQYAIETEKYDALSQWPAYEIHSYWDPEIILSRNEINRLENNRSQSLQQTWNNTLTYDLNINKQHDISVLGGYSEIAYSYDDLMANGRDFYNNDLLNLSQSDPLNRGVSSAYSDWGLRSLFGRVRYGFRNKYLFEFNMRYDGSSRFPEGSRYTFFPSVSGAWLLSEENFWQPLKHVADLFKIRASYGENGNQNIGLYSYFNNLSVGNYYSFNGVPAVGVAQTVFASQNLTWETTTQTNIGLDASFLNGKFGLTFDWYKKLTDGILLGLPIPGAVGLDPVATNAGKVQNTGWELQLTHRNKINDFHYGVTFNLSDVKNKVIDLAGTGPYYSLEKNRYVIMEGEEINALWGRPTAGYLTQEDIDKGYPTFSSDAKPGDIKYLDIDGDNKITATDNKVLGSSMPHWTYGMNIELGWKNFDCTMLWQGVGKQDMMVWGAFIENGSWEGFTLDIGKDYWTPENTDARFPRPQKSANKNTEPSDFWVLDASYLRLKNFQLGYTIPKTLLKKAKINSLRFYIGGTNLLTFSKLKEWGMDAETPAGRAGDFYQQVKTYSAGVNLDF
ncbi:TonB-dependent receptor [Chitinophaga cymbidii]|nr:TonB-dependent receptor [Chitinophaga cymbidii]